MNPNRARRLRRIAGTGAFALVVFLISFKLSIPYDRVKDQIVAMAAAQDLDVEVGDSGPTLGMGVSLSDVTVRTRAEPGKKPTVVRIESASIGLSPLAQLRGDLAYSVALETMGGEIEADVLTAKTRGETKVTTSQISMAELPGVREAINLPLGGKLDLALELAQPNNRNGEASGTLTWKCAACVLGDGKEKLKVPGNPLLAEGISLPRIKLGDFAGKVVFEKGVGRLHGVHAKSSDAEVRIEGEVRLADPAALTYLDLYIQFKFSEALLKSSDKLQLLMQIAEPMGKRPDGFFGFRLSGSARRLGPVQWMKTSPLPPPSSGGRPGGTRAAAPAGGSRPERLGVVSQPVVGKPVMAQPAQDDVEPIAVDPQTNPNANLPRYVTSPPPRE